MSALARESSHSSAYSPVTSIPLSVAGGYSEPGGKVGDVSWVGGGRVIGRDLVVVGDLDVGAG